MAECSIEDFSVKLSSKKSMVNGLLKYTNFVLQKLQSRQAKAQNTLGAFSLVNS